MNHEQVLKTQEVFRGRGMTVRVDTVTTPSGRSTTREVVQRSNAVTIIAVDKNDTIFMVRQYRHCVNQELLELPAGMIEPGETPEDCARRELQEEIGFLPNKLEELGGWYMAPGFCTEFMHFFLATDLIPKRLFADDTDEIDVIALNATDALAFINAKKIRDGKTIAGLLLYLNLNKTGRRQHIINKIQP